MEYARKDNTSRTKMSKANNIQLGEEQNRHVPKDLYDSPVMQLPQSRPS
jgi:hypothetical protein